MRSVFKWVFGLLAVVLVLSVLALGLVVVALNAVWSLLHGRKPAVLTTFSHFKRASDQFSGQFKQGRAPWASPGAKGPLHRAGAQGDTVVDVQAREVGEGAAAKLLERP